MPLGARGRIIPAVAAPPPTGLTFPNQPADFVVTYDADNGVLPALINAWNSEGTGVYTTSSRLSLLNEAPAGDSNGVSYRLLFPQGMGGGAAPYKWSTYYWNRSASQWNPFGVTYPNAGGLYLCAYLRVSSNWTDNGNAGTKFAFLRTDTYDGGSGAVSHYINLTTGGTPRWGINMEFVGGAGNRNFVGTSIANIGDGNWHRCEVLLLPNTPGVPNGTIRTWVDGNLDTNASDVLIFGAGQTPGWAYVLVDPTYGGGLNPVPYNLFLDVARMRCAVK